MKYAIFEAKEAAKRGEIPIGAAILNEDGELICKTGNRNIELNDPTSHAEILAIRLACSILGQNRLWGCSIYVTLEPCAMCAASIAFARLKNLYFGAYDEKFGAIENGVRLYNKKFINFLPEIYPSIEEKNCSSLISEYFKQLRNY